MTNQLLGIMSKLRTYKVTCWDTSSSFLGESQETREPATIFEGANVVSSQREDAEGSHALLLDLDVPAQLVPSSTPGHSHLYVDVEIPEEAYFRLLDLLAECGVIQPGYAIASKRKGGTALRLPWVKKEGRAA